MFALSARGREELIDLAKKNHVDLPGVAITDKTATVDIGTLDPLKIAQILNMRSRGNHDLVIQGLTSAFCFLQGSSEGVQKMIDVAKNVSKLEHHF